MVIALNDFTQETNKHQIVKQNRVWGQAQQPASKNRSLDRYPAIS